MQIFNTQSQLSAFLNQPESREKAIGFVPTMGALHQGHVSLIKAAKTQNSLVVCSIFVNPTQFNNAEDLANYPRTEEHDIAILKDAGCDILFLPSKEELYPEGVKSAKYNFGPLETEMEGKHRPGHFSGMATIVNKLLRAVSPNRAYFGEKDFQQLAIVKSLVKSEDLDIDIVGCPIVRESDGLAMSSRNLRLRPNVRQSVPAIYQSLLSLKSLKTTKTVQKAISKTIEAINAHPTLAVEYLLVCDEDIMQPIEDWNESAKPRAFVAVLAGDIRLIDNLAL